jgi:hypothetical protein
MDSNVEDLGKGYWKKHSQKYIKLGESSEEGNGSKRAVLPMMMMMTMIMMIN